MKVDLNELAAAFAQSDVRQGYVDLRQGKVILMDEDMAEEDTLHHAFDMEDDWEHYIPLPNVVDEDEYDDEGICRGAERGVPHASARGPAGYGGGLAFPSSGASSPAEAGLGRIQADIPARCRARLV